MAKIYKFPSSEGVSIMSISIFDVANTFLNTEAMSHKKLQKLCYYAQAWHLALFDEPLFDSQFQAWVHGPVCPELYAHYREFGWQTIPSVEIIPDEINQAPDKLKLIELIYRTYGVLDGDQLEMLTHSETPWINERKGLDPWNSSNNPINQDEMRKFYLAEFEKSQNN